MSRSDVVIAMPCLNEVRKVVSVIEALLKDPAAERCRLLLLDGGSTDGTCELVRGTFGDRVEIIDNPRRIQAHAVNLAAQMAVQDGAKYLLRVDLHSVYPVPFLSTLLTRMDETKADSIVVPMVTHGGNTVQEAGAAIYKSWLGNGGSPHRRGQRGWVEHGHHALFRLEAFIDTGGYDTEFAANEDAEFDKRLSTSGGRIYLDNGASIGYFPRETLTAAFHQFKRNGRFRIWTAVKHKAGLGLRQLLPLSLVPILACAALLGLVWPPLWIIPLAYISIVLVLSAKACASHESDIAIVPLVATAALLSMVSHIGFSLGGLYGLYELFLARPDVSQSLRSRDHSKLQL